MWVRTAAVGDFPQFVSESVNQGGRGEEGRPGPPPARLHDNSAGCGAGAGAAGAERDGAASPTQRRSLLPAPVHLQPQDLRLEAPSSSSHGAPLRLHPVLQAAERWVLLLLSLSFPSQTLRLRRRDAAELRLRLELKLWLFCRYLTVILKIRQQ